MVKSRISLVALAVLVAGCGSTTSLTNVWSPPDAQPIRFDKVIAVGVTSQASLRRSMEDEMVRAMTGTRADASYRVLTEDEFADQDAARRKIAAEGYDGAVIMRVVREGTEQTYVPGSPMPSPYMSPYGYWGYSYGYAYSPGYVQTNQVVTVETNVYSLTDDKLVWSAQSETMNPENVIELVDGVADATMREMRSRGLLQD